MKDKTTGSVSGIDFSEMRTGFRTYEIEISRDDKGYWFDIHQIDQISGDDFRVKECITSSELHATREEAISAAKAWLQGG